MYKPRARSYVRNSHQSIGIICLFLASIESVNDARVTRPEKLLKYRTVITCTWIRKTVVSVVLSSSISVCCPSSIYGWVLFQGESKKYKKTLLGFFRMTFVFSILSFKVDVSSSPDQSIKIKVLSLFLFSPIFTVGKHCLYVYYLRYTHCKNNCKREGQNNMLAGPVGCSYYSDVGSPA